MSAYLCSLKSGNYRYGHCTKFSLGLTKLFMKKTFFVLVVLMSCISKMLIGQIVYIAHSGTKFHESSCRTLAKGKTAIELSSALADRYVACKICKPNQTIAGIEKTKSIINPNEYQENNSTTTQCTAKTKAGTRCSRTTKSSNYKCWQHKKN